MNKLENSLDWRLEKTDSSIILEKASPLYQHFSCQQGSSSLPQLMFSAPVNQHPRSQEAGSSIAPMFSAPVYQQPVGSSALMIASDKVPVCQDFQSQQDGSSIAPIFSAPVYQQSPAQQGASSSALSLSHDYEKALVYQQQTGLSTVFPCIPAALSSAWWPYL